MRENDDGRAGGDRLKIALKPLQLLIAKGSPAVNLRHIIQTCKVDAFMLEAVPAFALGSFAISLQILFAIIYAGVMLTRHIEDLLRVRALQKLLQRIKLFRLGRMGEIAGMDHEFRLFRQGIDLVHRGLKSAVHIRIGGFAKANVTIADLQEMQIVFTALVMGFLAENPRGGNSSGNGPYDSCAGPGHALEKTPTVNSIFVVVVQNLVFFGSDHWIVSLLVVFLLGVNQGRPGFIPRGRVFSRNWLKNDFAFLAGIKISSHSYTQRRVTNLRNEEFEELALPLLDSLYNFACWLCHDRDEANDLVQESFAKALKAFGSFQAGTNFRAWMFTILRNVFLTSRTALERRNTVVEEEGEIDKVDALQDTPETLLLRKADTELVQAAIASLSPPFREVVLLADVEEMKYLEIAETLGIPIGTVMSRLARARKQIREHILRVMGVKS